MHRPNLTVHVRYILSLHVHWLKSKKEKMKKMVKTNYLFILPLVMLVSF